MFNSLSSRIMADIIHLLFLQLYYAIATQALETKVTVIDYVLGLDEDKDTSNVQPFATLKLDTIGSLPSEFTICSAISAPIIQSDLLFFSLRGENENFYNSVLINVQDTGDFMNDIFVLFHSKAHKSGQVPVVFPSQWIKGCTSIDSEKGIFLH